MNELENAISGRIANLDCEISPRELDAYRESLKAIEKTMAKLACYCEAKRDAMELRLEGKISLAIKYEGICDSIYKQLPDWAKW